MKLRNILSFATLAISVVALVLALRRPAPVAPALAPATAAADAQSFQEKVNQLTAPKAGGEGESEVRVNSAELSAALAQAAGLLPVTTPTPANPSASASSGGGAPSVSPGLEYPGAVPNIKDYQVSMDRVLGARAISHADRGEGRVSHAGRGSSRLQRRLRDFRYHGSQGRRSLGASFSGQSSFAKETRRTARPAEAS